MQNVLITGGSGFLGREIGRWLVRDGFSVRATVRTPPQPALPQGVHPVIVPDALDRAALRQACERASVVIHLAGLVHVSERRRENLDAFRRINVEGTRALLECALAAGVGTVLFMSSAAASSGDPPAPGEEGAPDGAYGRSKREAEDVIHEVAQRERIRAAILRPAMTYGPGMKGNPLALFRLVARGVPVPVARTPNRRSVLFSGNLAAAIAALLRSPPAGSETFDVADEEPLSTEQLVCTIARAFGRKPRLLRLPLPLLRLAGRVGELPATRHLWPLDARAVRRLAGSHVLDTSALRDATHFVPPYATADAIEWTAGWFRDPSAAPEQPAVVRRPCQPLRA